ncbi:MAG: TonB-dependent receptor [Deltaproteobacteria bacterium]
MEREFGREDGLHAHPSAARGFGNRDGAHGGPSAQTSGPSRRADVAAAKRRRAAKARRAGGCIGDGRGAWIGLLAVVATAARAHAQDIPLAPVAEGSRSSGRLETYVVTATRIREPLADMPQTVEVLTSEDMQSREQPMISDILRQATGVQVQQTGELGAQTSVNIRGSDPDQVLTLIDGVQVNAGTFGAFNYANLVPEPFDRVEVLRGGGGSLYGSEAIGGVVNFITRHGVGNGGGMISGAGGNGDTDREAATFSAERGGFGLAGAATHYGTAGFGPGIPLDAEGTRTVHNTAFDLTTASLRGDWRPTETGDLYAIGHYIRSHVGLQDANNYLGVLDPNARQDEDFWFGKVGWEDAPLEGLSYRVDGAYVQDDARYADPPDGLNPAETRSSIPTATIQGDAQANYAWRKWSVTTLGFQYIRRTATVDSLFVSGDPYYTSFDVGRNDYGVFAQQQVRPFGDALVLIGSIRWDNDSQFGDVVVPAANAAWRYERTGSRLRASYAEGFRAPSFNELYFPDFGNPNLAPERSSEWDVGLDQEIFSPLYTISFTWFDRRVKDDIVTVLVDPENLVFQPENVGHVDTQGFEVVPAVDLGHGLTAGASYTYTGIRSSVASEPVLRRPYNLLAAFAMLRRPRLLAAADAFEARVDVFYTGNRPDVDAETGAYVQNPGYARVDLALAWQLPWKLAGVAFTAFGNVSNLLDRTYEDVLGFPTRPLNVLFGLRATF